MVFGLVVLGILAPISNEEWLIPLDAFGLSREPMMAVAGDGSFVVANRSGVELHFFDAEGRFRFSKGGFGVGYGEFRGIDRLQYAAFADMFAAFDFAAGSITYFQRNGDIARTLNHPEGTISGASFTNPQSTVYLKVDRESRHRRCGVFRFDFEGNRETLLHALAEEDHAIRPIHYSAHNGYGEPWCPNLLMGTTGSVLVLKMPREKKLGLWPLTEGNEPILAVTLPEYLQTGASLRVDEPGGRLWLWKRFGQAFLFQVYDLKLRSVGKGHFSHHPIAFLGDWVFLLRQDPDQPFQIVRKPIIFD